MGIYDLVILFAFLQWYFRRRERKLIERLQAPQVDNPAIKRTPQQEVAESVRFALRVGVTPEQIKEIVVSEVSAYRAKAANPAAGTPAAQSTP